LIESWKKWTESRRRPKLLNWPLDVSNVISIITNTAGFIFKLVQVVLVYFTSRKSSMVTNSDLVIHKLPIRECIITYSIPSSTSVEMTNTVYNMDITSAVTATTDDS
jgi:hypothetical protein